MRYVLMSIVVFLFGCNLDFPGLTELDDSALELSEQAQVADVLCTTDELSVASNEEGLCQAFNEAGTRLQIDSYPAVISWWSSAPASISVALDGEIRAESETGEAWIFASGTHDSVDSVLVTAVE